MHTNQDMRKESLPTLPNLTGPVIELIIYSLNK